MNNNNDIENGNETFYYCGEHVDGRDEYGPIIVYHYISKHKLNGRNLSHLDDWEYDLEIWPGDNHWRQASQKEDILINFEDIEYM